MQPKQPIGRIPGKEFVSGGDAPFAGTKIGLITRVDEIHMKADIKMITGNEERFEIDLTQAMCGPRSFLGGIPEVNSLVIIAYRRRQKQLYDAVILGYIPTGNLAGLRFDPFSHVNPNAVDPEDQEDVNDFYGKTLRYKRIRGKPGDIMGMSAAGAEMHLSADVKLSNQAGDLIELRAVDRTLLSQAIHRVESDSASYFFSGAARRGGMNLPLEIFQKEAGAPVTTGSNAAVTFSRTVRSEKERYFGRDELASAGIAPNTFIDPTTGKILDRINDNTEFPPLTYSNGRQVFYASENPATNFEDALGADGSGRAGGNMRAFTERRLEMSHDTDLQQQVLEEFDGFQVDRPRAYIEQVFGTVIGNDQFSTLGQRQYGRPLKPSIFEDFHQLKKPTGFRMEEAARPPSVGVDEALTMAAAYLFQMNPPRAGSKDKFAIAVSKQGKVFLNIPGSAIENGAVKNISAEVNLGGALKAHIGACSPDNISIQLSCEGGIHLDLGSNSDGRAITTNFRSSVQTNYVGVPDTDDVARSANIIGNDESTISGNDSQVVNGAYQKKVSGGYNIQCSRGNINAFNGWTLNAGELNQLISGKSQNNFAMLVTETIALGGHIKTILAGAVTETLLAGAKATNVLAGATVFNNPAGAFSITVGAGAISITTGAGAVSMTTGAGAMSLTAGAGAIAITAGLAVNITAAIAISLLSPQVLLGGPPAVLGVCRGLPMHPPGSPSLDWITSLPLQGCALIRSI